MKVFSSWLDKCGAQFELDIHSASFTYRLYLEQGFLYGTGGFRHQMTFAISGDIFVCHSWGEEECY